MKRIISLICVLVMITSAFTSCGIFGKDPEPEKNELDGKRVLFIGNSYTYYGKAVLEKKQSVRDQSARDEDHGYFYQICKESGKTVDVTNWTYGGHHFDDLFGICDADRGCNGVDHAADLVDRNFDYVVMQQGSGSAYLYGAMDKVEEVMGLFREVNPDVKFVFLVQTDVHNKGYVWRYQIKELEQKGVIIVDWGALVCDIINGVTAVPGATEEYNKNSFIVCKSATDGYHPNMLTGYVTALMTYCAITGESAVGQSYSFCGDTAVESAFDFDKFIASHYTYNGATTNFPEIFASESDMRGIQQLIDRYLAEKPYLNY